MFNIQPGQGLGNGPSKLLAFGLGLWEEYTPPETVIRILRTLMGIGR